MFKTSYYYLPIELDSTKGCLEWLGSVLPTHIVINENYNALIMDDVVAGNRAHNISIKVGSKNKYLLFNTKTVHSSLDDRAFTRIRIDGWEGEVIELFDSLTLELDGWYGRNSKDFVRPKTGEQVYLYLGGEQDIEELSKTDAIERILSKAEGYSADALNAVPMKCIADIYLKHCRVEAVIVDDKIVVPIPKYETLK